MSHKARAEEVIEDGFPALHRREAKVVEPQSTFLKTFSFALASGFIILIGTLAITAVSFKSYKEVNIKPFFHS